MPRYRQIHTKIVDSFDFNEMPNDFVRLVWMLLIVVVDSEGRGIYNMAWIKSKMFPLREDIDLTELSFSFEWLRDRKMIIVYEVEGRSYFWVPTFKSYQSGTEKEAKSIFPSYIEEVRSNSIVTPEQVRSKSASDAYADTDSNADASGAPEISIFQKWCEQITGLTGSADDIVNSIKQFEEMQPIKEDIEIGYQWLKDNKKVVRYWRQLVEPTRYAMGQRLGKSNGNGRKRKLTGPDGEVVYV